MARQQKIRNDMERDERIAELEARIQTMQMQALQAGEGAPAPGDSLKVTDGALPSNVAPEEADILRATVAALKAQLASAKRELSARHAAATPAPSKTSEGEAGATDASHTTSTDEDDIGAAAARAAEAEVELYELRERVAVLNKELIELKAENRELLVAGLSSPVPREGATAEAGGSTEEDEVSEAAQVEQPAGSDASPPASGADTDAAEEQETAVEALEQSLLRARTDIARLQLANTKLVTKLQTMEKTNVASEAKLKRLGGDSDTESLRSNLGKLREQVESLRQERKSLVPATELSKAQEELKAAEVRLQALQNDYDSFMGEHCMLDLAKAKTDLQQRNHALQEEAQSLRSRITDFHADAKAAQAEIEELKTERKATREHMDKLKQALAKKLSAPGSGGSGGGSGADGSLLQEEVRALINENLGMRETIEELEAKVATLEGALEEARRGLPASGAGAGLGRASSATSMASTAGGSGGGAGGMQGGNTSMATQAVQYKGMLKFREKDIQRVVSALVLRLGPSSLPQALPGLPAHLLFMCVLYADHVENAAMLQGLLTKAMTAMKQVVMQNAADIDVLAYWLSNGYRLLSNMKQFSGEPQFKTRDDELSLTLNTFDLQEYRIVLSDLLVQIYHTVLKHVEVQLTPMIVPGMLDYESLPGAGSAAAAGGRRGGHSGVAGGKPAAKVDDIVRLFNSVLQAMQRQCVEPRLVQQVFKQLFYVVNAIMVNNLLLRKDLARLTKGMQVRYNISKLQDWARDNNLEQIGSALIEAVQITQLLQCNKTKADDVDTIFTTCVNLNPLQIQKVLTMYTPEEFESRVPAALLRAVQERESQAKGARGASEGGAAKLLMDTGHMFSVTFPFTPSTPKFPTLELPADLELDFVEKI